jgi:hypothetical protein
MATDTITHETVSQLVEAGAIRAAHVVGQKGGWGVLFKYGMTERPLAAQRGNLRVFKRFETIVSYLREMGIVQFDVDAAQYDPSAPLSARSQSNAERAREQMKAAHQAAAYDKWFRAEIGAALVEADDPATVKVAHADVAAGLRSGDTAALRALAGKPAGRSVSKPRRKAHA